MSWVAVGVGVASVAATAITSATSDSGGGGGGGGVTQAPLMTWDQQNLLHMLTSKVAGELNLGVPAYEGEIAPGASELQQQAFDKAKLLGTTDRDVQRQEALARGLADPNYRFRPEDYEKYYDEKVRKPSEMEWKRDVLPQILHQYGSGGDTGALARALSMSGADLQTNRDAQRAQMGLEGLKAEQTAMEGYYNRIPAVGAADLKDQYSSILTQASLGDTQRNIKGQQNAADLWKWEYSRPYNNPWVTQYSQLALGSQSQQPIYIPPAQGGSGGGGGGAGGYLQGAGSLLQGVAAVAPFFA